MLKPWRVVRHRARLRRDASSRSTRPDGVKGSLVERQEPARADPVVLRDVVEADGRPPLLAAAECRGAVRERAHVPGLADQDVPTMHAECAGGEIATAREVGKDLVDPVVAPGD